MGPRARGDSGTVRGINKCFPSPGRPLASRLFNSSDTSIFFFTVSDTSMHGLWTLQAEQKNETRGIFARRTLSLLQRNSVCLLEEHVFIFIFCFTVHRWITFFIHMCSPEHMAWLVWP